MYNQAIHDITEDTWLSSSLPLQLVMYLKTSSRSRKNFILVSSYLKLNACIKEMLLSKIDSGVTARVVYRKTEMAEFELSWFAEYPDIRLFYSDNLYAKCYLTDSVVLIILCHFFILCKTETKNDHTNIRYGSRTVSHA